MAIQWKALPKKYNKMFEHITQCICMKEVIVSTKQSMNI